MKILIGYENDQVYLNEHALADAGVSLDQAVALARRVLKQHVGVAAVYSRTEILAASSDVTDVLKRGFHPTRSGPLHVVVKERWLSDGKVAGYHGSVYAPDRKIPIAFLDTRFSPRVVTGLVRADDIGPTLLDLQPDKQRALDSFRV